MKTATNKNQTSSTHLPPTFFLKMGPVEPSSTAVYFCRQDPLKIALPQQRLLGNSWLPMMDSALIGVPVKLAASE
ncbi:hypothetical protein HanRHA438_Chr17g0826081 [Helianthus annuus]|nr:hypothetical protein HanRHA438_Chr17g0826081 [Helianthus annuus]